VGDQKPCLTQRRIGTSQGDCCRCVVAAGDLPPPLLPVIRSPRKSPPRASAPWSRLWLGVMGSPFRATVWVIRVKKVKVPELVPVFGSQPAGDMSHKAAGRLPLLSRRQVEISVGRPPDPSWKRPPGRPRTNGPTNSFAITTMFPLRLCGGKPLVAVTRERRYGPSRLHVNDDDDDDQIRGQMSAWDLAGQISGEG